MFSNRRPSTSWLSSARRVTTSSFPAHLMIFWRLARLMPRDLRASRGKGGGQLAFSFDARRPISTRWGSKDVHVAVAAVLGESSRVEVERDEGDVRVVHGLEFLRAGRREEE